MKPYPHRRLFSIITILLAAILACNIPLTSSSTSDLANVVAQTQTAIAIDQLVNPVTSISQVPISEATQSPAISIESTRNSTVIATTSPSVISTIPAIVNTAPATPDCTDMAKFEGETIPDNSAVAPGQEFIKIWTLRNVGTCTWNPEYALVLVKGEAMGGTSPSPIGTNVKPNNTIQIYLPQKAPDNSGEHQGSWMLRSPSGRVFGLGSKAEVAFWVKIQVVPGTANSNNGGSGITGPQNLGAPSWTESFDGKRNPWYLGADADISFDVKNGSLVMTAFQPIGDQWRVAASSYLDDFYLQANFRTGPACAGKDGYGLLVRAPDKPSGNINTGYVFSFSCEGKYRIYRMDNGNFNSIVNWTSTPAIKAGSNQTNSMGIFAKADKLQLYANGALVSEISDSMYSGGLFGLVIRSDVTRNFQAFVDEVAYWLVR
jgi:Ig-like domain from next to BRCA1 gene/3-keto-disaccharide hydrolase